MALKGDRAFSFLSKGNLLPKTYAMGSSSLKIVLDFTQNLTGYRVNYYARPVGLDSTELASQ